MSLYEILNSIDLSLEKNINSYDNSIIDNFVDELKNILQLQTLWKNYQKFQKILYLL